jgi:hypothetical protein
MLLVLSDDELNTYGLTATDPIEQETNDLQDARYWGITSRQEYTPATRGDMLRYRLAFAPGRHHALRRHALPGVMPAPMMVMKYPHRLGCINSGGISYAWCR